MMKRAIANSVVINITEAVKFRAIAARFENIAPQTPMKPIIAIAIPQPQIVQNDTSN